ncbi:MAG: YfhO family protein [Candidatus Komeilibacteria bacterium]
MNKFKFVSNTYFATGIVLVVLLLIFFYQPLVNKRTLVPLDILPEFDLALKNTSLSHNYLLSDLVDQFYPNYTLLRQSLSNGEFPLWNPHILTGLPFMADSQTGIFEFTHILSYAASISPLAFPLFSALILLLLLGLSFFVYLKNLRFDTLVSLFGAVVLMFSGTTIVWLNYPLLAAFVWLPLLLYCVDKIILAHEYRFLPLLSVVICLSLLAGYPQIALINLLVTGLYFLIRWLRHGCLKWNTLTLTILFVILGITLSAVQTGPSWDFISESQSYEVGRGFFAQDNVLEVAQKQVTNLGSSLNDGVQRMARYGILAFDPNYYGSPLTRNYRFPEDNPYANYSELTIYPGLLTIILALLAIIWSRKCKAIIFWLATAVVTFGLAADLPLLNLLKYLPLINKISLGRFRPLLVFAVVLLATYSLQKIINTWKNTKLKTIVVICLIVISFGDLFYFFHTYNLGTKAEAGFITQNPVVKFLQDNTTYERIVGLGPVNQGFRTPILPNTGILTGLYDVRGYNPIVGKNYITFSGTYLTQRGSFILADAVFDDQAIDLMSVKYLVCPATSCLFVNQTEKWEQEYADANVKIIKNPDFLPRAYIAYDYLDGQNEQLIKLFESNTLDINSQVLVANSIAATDLQKQPGSPIKPAEIIKYSNNKVIIKSQSDQSGILVLTDNYDADWQVTVNGQKQKVLQVNGIFRGVIVPAGTSEIVFTYWPKNFDLYIALSATSLLILIASGIIINKKSIGI